MAAYACNPKLGSEYGVGWGWVRAIAEHHDLWVLTGAQHRDAIRSELARCPGLESALHFRFIPRHRARLAERLWPPAYLHTYVRQWQRDAYRVARELHDRVRFHIAHQLTYVGYRVPGHLWRMGIPFVWGPIGGLEQTPWRLVLAAGAQGALYYSCRNLWNDFDRRFARAPREAFRRASGLIAATSGVQTEIRRFYHRDSEVVSEIGLPPLCARSPIRRAPGDPLRLIWSGNHNPGKALPLLLRALKSTPPDAAWTLTILGTGPCTNSWRRLCNRLGLASRCSWPGMIPRDSALREMQSAHALIVTSLCDLTSTVVVEALASALPVICPRLNGFPDAVTADCGFLVPAESRSGIVSGLARAILALHDDEALRARLAAAALERSRSFAWEHKAAVADDLYRRALAQLKA